MSQATPADRPLNGRLDPKELHNAGQAANRAGARSVETTPPLSAHLNRRISARRFRNIERAIPLPEQRRNVDLVQIGFWLWLGAISASFLGIVAMVLLGWLLAAFVFTVASLLLVYGGVRVVGVLLEMDP